MADNDLRKSLRGWVNANAKRSALQQEVDLAKAQITKKVINSLLEQQTPKDIYTPRTNGIPNINSIIDR
jgi:hypothetical protein